MCSLGAGHGGIRSYASRALIGVEKNDSVTEKECLAIWAIRQMSPYLAGYKFDVITNYMSLKWLNNIESPLGRISRWLFFYCNSTTMLSAKGRVS